MVFRDAVGQRLIMPKSRSRDHAYLCQSQRISQPAGRVRYNDEVNDDGYTKPGPVGGGVYNPTKEPRYTEIATFMRAPLAAALDNLDIGLTPTADLAPLGPKPNHRRQSSAERC
jgi:hypothetical protein